MRVRNTKTASAALACLLLLALCAPARAAVDPLYVGELDAVTGEAAADAEASEMAARAWLSDTMYYDRETGSFVYPVGGGEVRASVADGMIVNAPASVSAPEGVELTVRRSGAAEPEADPGNLSAPGHYAVSVADAGGGATLFAFTVVGESASLSGGYAMPESFYILDATLDGEEAVYDRNYIGMEDEGLYEIEYVCSETGVHYRLTTTIDRTPPQLTLSGKRDKKGRFCSAVQLGGLEGVVSASLTRDGAAAPFPSDGRLTEAGIYQLQVWDAAGNTATEQFTILVYLDLNGLLFFSLVSVSLIGVLAYILFKKKRFRAA